LVGKTAVTPFGDEVTIMTDEKVKMDKGSGAVMCCTYGDETDVYRTQKYHLQPKIIINRYGKIENSHIESLNGLKVDEARVVVANMLREKGAVVKETPIRQSVSFSERGKVRVEIIPIKQRFVNTIELKDTRHRRNDEMKRIPAWMQKRSTDRIDSLSWDWNISRNRTFGIPIPVRYSLKTGELILPTDAQLTNGAIDPSSQMPDALPAGHTRDDIEPETMVLDTWFTSGITPDINQYIAHKNGFV
jgi:valyl-tRNA synthetase